MLKRIPRRNHITPVLRELHWLRIHDRIIFKSLILTHKAVNNTAPEYLWNLIRLNVKSTTIRTRASFDPCLLCVPPISKTCANLLFDRSFGYVAPTFWNALDLDIRILPFDTFKKKCQDTSLSEVLCKLILIVFILFVWYFCFHNVYLLWLLFLVWMFKDKILNLLLTCDNCFPKGFTSTYTDKVIQGNSFGSSSSKWVQELALLNPELSKQVFVV